jgi:hypothetical protein
MSLANDKMKEIYRLHLQGIRTLELLRLSSPAMGTLEAMCLKGTSQNGKILDTLVIGWRSITCQSSFA